VALKYALAALSADGYDAEQWTIEKPYASTSGVTTAPWSSRYDLNSWLIHFYNKNQSVKLHMLERLVRVELKGDTVSCWVQMPK
jgi:hypothetical protein